MPAPVEEPGFISSLLDSPWVLPGAGVLVAGLAIFGMLRLRSQNRSDSGETSFLESRLQPDSFFGASGGQRVDTRDATGVPSSMSYSLSQLDAIGDVDPVAEADVYLAYGRDLQAEEILKEAMRANPERMAIRTKLLEVYAKRRDTKGYELLATQMYSLTGGEGEDWSRAQQLGREVDADNPLYQAGGRPEGAGASGGPIVEPLGASTMPQSVLPSPSSFDAQRSMHEDDPSLDLDLDISQPGRLEAAPLRAAEVTQPLPRSTQAPSPAPSLPPLDEGLRFNLGDMGTPAAKSAFANEPPTVQSGFDDLPSLDLNAEPLSEESLERKLELAEEFRQIGDMEGARDLLQEVVTRASGSLKSKAQGLLDQLA
jgi:pilus assembly protein FimV